MRPLSALAVVALLGVPSVEVGAAESTLDGWGSYKFGMTADEVQNTGTLNWRRFPAPKNLQSPDFDFSLFATNTTQYSRTPMEQFGLHPWLVSLEFDNEGRLSKIRLSNTRGGLTLGDCRTRFEGLLTKLENRYGSFEAAGDEWDNEKGPESQTGATKTEVVHSLSGTKSQYSAMVMTNFQDAAHNPDQKNYNAIATRKYDVRSITVQMGDAENPKQLQLPNFMQISDDVLALVPNLNRPACSIVVVYQSKIPVPRTTATLTLPKSPPSQNFQQLDGDLQAFFQDKPASKDPQQAKLDKLNEDLSKIFDFNAAPHDSLQNAYTTAFTSNDDEDAEILLEHMTPAQRALAAYARHDYPLAIELWTPLAEKGDADAAASIASTYDYGSGGGVPKDHAKAVMWEKIAASLGDGGSQDGLGNDYANGNGVPKDNVRAYMWYTMAIEQAAKGTWRSMIPTLPTQTSKKRDAIAAKMDADEITRAKAMADKCRQSNYQGCD